MDVEKVKYESGNSRYNHFLFASTFGGKKMTKKKRSKKNKTRRT